LVASIVGSSSCPAIVTYTGVTNSVTYMYGNYILHNIHNCA